MSTISDIKEGQAWADENGTVFTVKFLYKAPVGHCVIIEPWFPPPNSTVAASVFLEKFTRKPDFDK